MEWAPNSTFNEPSGDACDHYHRYPEDIAMLAELGLNAYRFSLEWSRIEPEPGFYSRAALDHYGRMIESCLNQGVTPVVTYNHFTVPRWMAGRGGWSAADAPARFADYASRVTQHVGDLLSWVCTLNEPNLMAMMRSTGVLAMGAGDRPPTTRAGRVGRRRASGASTRRATGWGSWRPTSSRWPRPIAWRSRPSRRPPGPSRRGGPWRSSTSSRRRAARSGGARRGGWARPTGSPSPPTTTSSGCRPTPGPASGRTASFLRPTGSATMQTGWEVYPEALGHTVRLAAEHAGVPVLVTENGMATDDDEARIAYTRAALEGLARCMADGIDVRGYIHWTLLDNFEWNAGYSKTFGLIAVDREDLRPYGQAVRPLAGPGGPAQRPRLNAQRRSASGGPSTSKPTRSTSGARRARSKP